MVGALFRVLLLVVIIIAEFWRGAPAEIAPDH
jgi:hypothetical protein